MNTSVLSSRPTWMSALLIGWLPFGVVHAEEEPSPMPPASHPIEHKSDSCMEEGDWTTQAIQACTEQAEEDWEEEIERLTQTLERVLGGEAREALKTAQATWEESRDADYDFITAYHAELQRAELSEDALAPLAEQLHRNNVLQDRALQLQRYLEGLEELRAPEEEEKEEDA